MNFAQFASLFRIAKVFRIVWVYSFAIWSLHLTVDYAAKKKQNTKSVTNKRNIFQELPAIAMSVFLLLALCTVLFVPKMFEKWLKQIVRWKWPTSIAPSLNMFANHYWRLHKRIFYQLKLNACQWCECIMCSVSVVFVTNSFGINIENWMVNFMFA